MSELDKLELEWSIAFVNGVKALPVCEKTGLAILGRQYKEVLKPRLDNISAKINIIKRGK